jgi:hypothetical protein
VTTERDHLRAQAAHLVGAAEIAALLKVNANTINTWKVRHPDFPLPLRRLKGLDIWDDRDVLDWAAQTGRKIGDTTLGAGT